MLDLLRLIGFRNLTQNFPYLIPKYMCAFSEDATRLIVSADVEKADRTLDAVVTRLFERTDSLTPEIIVRSRS